MSIDHGSGGFVGNLSNYQPWCYSTSNSIMMLLPYLAKSLDNLVNVLVIGYLNNLRHCCAINLSIENTRYKKHTYKTKINILYLFLRLFYERLLYLFQVSSLLLVYFVRHHEPRVCVKSEELINKVNEWAERSATLTKWLRQSRGIER